MSNDNTAYHILVCVLQYTVLQCAVRTSNVFIERYGRPLHLKGGRVRKRKVFRAVTQRV